LTKPTELKLQEMTFRNRLIKLMRELEERKKPLLEFNSLESRLLEKPQNLEMKSRIWKTQLENVKRTR